MLANPIVTQMSAIPIAMGTGAGVMCGSIGAPFSTSHFQSASTFNHQSMSSIGIREPNFRMARLFSDSSEIVLAMASGFADDPSSIDDSRLPPSGSGNDGDGRVGSRFVRSRGETATIVTFERDIDELEELDEIPPPSRRLWQHLHHGDLVFNIESYRGEDAWIVVQKPGENKIVVQDTDGAGYAQISSAITKFIEDPIAFYAAATSGNLEIIKTIYFDPESHSDILKQLTGGRDVHPSRLVWWSESANGFEIDIPLSPRHPDGGTVELNHETPEEYLQNPAASKWTLEDPTEGISSMKPSYDDYSGSKARSKLFDYVGEIFSRADDAKFRIPVINYVLTKIDDEEFIEYMSCIEVILDHVDNSQSPDILGAMFARLSHLDNRYHEVKLRFYSILLSKCIERLDSDEPDIQKFTLNVLGAIDNSTYLKLYMSRPADADDVNSIFRHPVIESILSHYEEIREGLVELGLGEEAIANVISRALPHLFEHGIMMSEFFIEEMTDRFRELRKRVYDVAIEEMKKNWIGVDVVQNSVSSWMDIHGLQMQAPEVPSETMQGIISSAIQSGDEFSYENVSAPMHGRSRDDVERSHREEAERLFGTAHKALNGGWHRVDVAEKIAEGVADLPFTSGEIFREEDIEDEYEDLNVKELTHHMLMLLGEIYDSLINLGIDENTAEDLALRASAKMQDADEFLNIELSRLGYGN